MLVNKEVSLVNFKFWSGAVDTVSYLTESELETIESVLEDIYPDGMDETTLNDIFWFETDFIAEILGYDDWESLDADRESGDLIG